jgi:nucleosome binding factor SPN SPT16 subunit
MATIRSFWGTATYLHVSFACSHSAHLRAHLAFLCPACLFEHRAIWSNVTAFSLHRGPVVEDQPYLKSAIVQEYLFGYELTDTIVMLTLDGDLYVLTTKKKCDFLEAAAKIPKGSPLKAVHLLHKSKGDNNADNFETLLRAIPKSDEGKRIVGCLTKEADINTTGMVAAFEAALSEADDIEVVDNAAGLSFVLATKDDMELDLMKKSSVLSNKVMKHGCVARLEEIIDAEEKITHETFSAYIEEILEDPSKIKLKVPKEDVSACYNPIVQSGGEYDIKVSAASNSNELKYDIIIVSMGARYKSYCSNVARTFLVDPPKKVSETYEHLLGMQEACTKAMKPGKPFKNVYKAAVTYLQENNAEHLIPTLPKNLGFSIGMDFRDANLTLSPKNSATFKPGMTFSLACGFHNVELSEKDRSSTPKQSAVSSIGWSDCPPLALSLVLTLFVSFVPLGKIFGKVFSSPG